MELIHRDEPVDEMAVQVEDKKDVELEKKEEKHVMYLDDEFFTVDLILGSALWSILVRPVEFVQSCLFH